MIQKLLIGLAILLPIILGIVFAPKVTIVVILILLVLIWAYAIGNAIMEYKWRYM